LLLLSQSCHDLVTTRVIPIRYSADRVAENGSLDDLYPGALGPGFVIEFTK
jgi:hypothetical protein